MDDTVDLSAFYHDATVDLGDGNDTINMGLGDDTIEGGPGNDTFHQTLSTFNTTKTIDGGPGNDVLTIDGTPGDDNFKFSMAANHKDLIVQYTNPGAGSAVVQTVYKDFDTASIEQIVVSGYFGDDTFQIDESNGAIPATLTFQGGDGNDAIQLVGNPTVQSETLDFGSVPTFGGIDTLVIGGVTQTMVYDGFDLNSEFLEDSLPGPLVIQSNYASSGVVFGASTESADPNNPDFASIQGVDNVYGPIKFKNKTSLVYNGGTGGDSVLIDATALSLALPNLTSFIVNGGPSSDTVNVTGTPGPNLHIVVNGGAGDDVLSGDADLHGGDDDDQLTGGDGNYVLDGGDGDDVLLIDGSASLCGERPNFSSQHAHARE